MKLSIGRVFKRFIGSKEAIAIVLVVIVVLIMLIGSKAFRTLSNFDSLQTSIAPNAIIAAGMMILLISGVFDLSVGSVMTLSGVVVSLFLASGFPVMVSILFGLCTGIVFGIVNGVLVSLAGVNPLIATIGTMYIGRGLVNVILTGERRHGIEGFPESFIKLGTGKIFGIYNMFWIMILVVVISQFLIAKIPWGRRIYYIGGNYDAAKAIGIKTKKLRVFTYIISGLLASLAGILVTSRFEMSSKYIGEGMELRIIISCLIGGGSIAGGQGSIIGAFLGVMFMSLLINSFNLFEIGAFWQSIIIGLILIIVVTSDAYLTTRKLKAVGKL